MTLLFDLALGRFQGLDSRQYTISVKAWLELPLNCHA
mgnify:CR=1 FL=1|jgi:hypothetical protein